MPMMLAGLWRGGQGLQVSMACMTLSSMRTEEAKLAAVDDAVAHCVDLAHGGDDAVGRAYQGVEHGLMASGVGGHGDVDGVQLGLVGQLGLIGELAVDTDVLHRPLASRSPVAGSSS